MKSLTGKELIKLLKSIEWELARIKGQSSYFCKRWI